MPGREGRGSVISSELDISLIKAFSKFIHLYWNVIFISSANIHTFYSSCLLQLLKVGEPCPFKVMNFFCPCLSNIDVPPPPPTLDSGYRYLLYNCIGNIFQNPVIRLIIFFPRSHETMAVLFKTYFLWQIFAIIIWLGPCNLHIHFLTFDMYQSATIYAFIWAIIYDRIINDFK